MVALVSCTTCTRGIILNRNRPSTWAGKTRVLTIPSGSVTSRLLEGLVPDTVYQLSLRARSSQGSGVLSREVTVRTSEFGKWSISRSFRCNGLEATTTRNPCFLVCFVLILWLQKYSLMRDAVTLRHLARQFHQFCCLEFKPWQCLNAISFFVSNSHALKNNRFAFLRVRMRRGEGVAFVCVCVCVCVCVLFLFETDNMLTLSWNSSPCSFRLYPLCTLHVLFSTRFCMDASGCVAVAAVCSSLF